MELTYKEALDLQNLHGVSTAGTSNRNKLWSEVKVFESGEVVIFVGKGPTYTNVSIWEGSEFRPLDRDRFQKLFDYYSRRPPNSREG